MQYEDPNGIGEAVIYKFPLLANLISRPLTDRVLYKVLHVGFDPGGKPCVWAEVVPSVQSAYDTYVRIVGTGEEVPLGTDHIGTYTEGPFVWHVYMERVKR